MEEALKNPKKTRGVPFKKGNPGGPGRPKGSISIITRIKQIFEEHPERFEEYIEGIISDEKLRKEIIQQIDGSPSQKIDVTSGGERIQFGVVSFDDYDSLSAETE